MPQPPIVVAAPYLTPAARLAAADRAAAWAARQATTTVEKLNQAASDIATFAELLAAKTTRHHAVILGDLAFAQARVQILARAAQGFVDAAGSRAPEAVVERLAGLPGSQR